MQNAQQNNEYVPRNVSLKEQFTQNGMGKAMAYS